MTRPPLRNKLTDPETSSTTPTLINAVPLIRGVSHGVEEAVDKERAIQEIELEAKAERDRQAGEQGEGKEQKKDDEPDVYDRFPKSKKRTILLIVSYAAFLGPVTSSCFLPSIPQIASDLTTTSEVIGYTVAIFVFTIGAAPLVWSTLSGYYGRRVIYLWSIPVYVASSVGVARCGTVGQLIATRVLQAIGSSAVLAVGSGSIGDIYRSCIVAHHRWAVSGIYLCFGALAFVLVYFFLPETWHGETPHAKECRERGKRFVIHRFNPVKSVALLRWPNVAAISFNSSAVMLCTYAVLVPLSTIFKERYHLDNAAVLGALYLAPGMGNLVGSRVAGIHADRTVRKWLEKRGFRRPEDRLYATLFGALFVMPASLLIAGWLIQTGKGGMGPPLVFLFFNGIGLMQVLTPSNVYLVDASQTRSAEAIAINNFVRYTFAAGASAGALPCINAIGTGWTNTIAAIIGYIGAGLILLTLRYGEKWRKSANERYGITYKEADEYKKEEKGEDAT